MTNLLTTIGETVEASPEATAIGFENRKISYKELWDRTRKFAYALSEAGIEPGDRIGIYLPNIPEYVTAFHGILCAGGVVVPMNPQYKSREIKHLLADSGAKAVVGLSERIGHITKIQDETNVETVVSVGTTTKDTIKFETFLADDTLDIIDRADDEVAVQPYTSGTTGKSKGVLLTHSNLEFEARVSPQIHDGIDMTDKMLGVLPLFHIYGMTVTMLATLYGGGSYHLVSEWDARETLDLISDEGITLMHAVPTMYNDLVNHPAAEDHNLETIRFANAGGSSLPREVIRRFEELFEPSLLEGYGLTETSPVTHANRLADRRIGSIGKPLPGIESKIVNKNFEELPSVEQGPVNDETNLEDVVGELVIHGPNVMKGYHSLDSANQKAFTEERTKRWFHTGDLGYQDEDSFFYIVDREKHMIVTGGYNVYPREVEELLFEHEGVADAAVVGIEDERRGETVKAFVVPQPTIEVTPEEIKQYCLENLAEYKHPREVKFVDNLPRTTTGKIQKFVLESEE
ncbi:long-chain-fatty-acid--CoA ligase [Halalkalicoccus subterraneus]|uniref:long-chain-fatty-acid--CoA ligase n=1 Tax=Halalkalicoccus subterraneus TaxID=2675002 RepID=UPI000EFBA108|nr:long-chain fatty acid--CoA ligase [Halalkalicoccus subterraneus]